MKEVSSIPISVDGVKWFHLSWSQNFYFPSLLEDNAELKKTTKNQMNKYAPKNFERIGQD